MNLQQYQTNLINIEELLLTIKEEGNFARNLTRGYAQVSISAEYFHTEPHKIGARAANFLRLATIRKIDLAVLQLLRLADECGVDIIDELIDSLPKTYLTYAADMQQPLEYFLEGELK